MWLRGTLKAVPGLDYFQQGSKNDDYLHKQYKVPNDDVALISDGGVIIHYRYMQGISFIVASRPTQQGFPETRKADSYATVDHVVLAGPFEKNEQAKAAAAFEEIARQVGLASATETKGA